MVFWPTMTTSNFRSKWEKICFWRLFLFYLLAEARASQPYPFPHMATPTGIKINILLYINNSSYLTNGGPQLCVCLVHLPCTSHLDTQILQNIISYLHPIDLQKLSNLSFKLDNGRLLIWLVKTYYKNVFQTSRMRAKSVVVKWTVPSSSIGWFIRISFLKARRSGHLLPNPSGGSIFFSMSYISE